MPRGRISNANRPVIDWSALPDAVEVASVPVAARRTVEDIPPFIRALVDRAYDSRKLLAQPVPNEATGQEIARLLRAYGKLRHLAVGAVVVTQDDTWSVRVSARDKAHRQASVSAPATVPGDALPGKPTGRRNGTRATGTK